MSYIAKTIAQAENKFRNAYLLLSDHGDNPSQFKKYGYAQPREVQEVHRFRFTNLQPTL